MVARIVIALALVAGSWVPGRAQDFEGSFYPAKHAYVVGEPVFVLFELQNKSGESQEVGLATSSGYCAIVQGLRVTIPGSPALMPSGLGCATGFVGSCLGGIVRLAPGQAYRKRHLLNDWFQLTEPGAYQVTISQQLRFLGSETRNVERTEDVTSSFPILIESGEESKVRTAYESIISDLGSTDYVRRFEALHVIGTMAPPFLEDLIVGMARSDDVSIQATAVNGLERLNNARARRELARLAEEGATLGTQQQAVFALGRIGNLAYLPLLKRLAGHSERTIQYAAIRATGQVGGQDAVGFLLSLLRSEDPAVRHDAVFGLAYTGSREAVPVLIGMLLDPSPLVRQSAADALPTITHRSVLVDVQDLARMGEAARRWRRWWASNGTGVEVFGPRDCGPAQPLE